MPNWWNQIGVPHKGWVLNEVIDIREDGQSAEETPYETCMMCGNEKIRFVHIVSHNEVEEEYRVGCVCAERMTNDYINPKGKENELRNRANRRNTWIKKTWKLSKTGNIYLNHKEHHIVIFKDKSQKYKVIIDDIFGKKTFQELHKAKIAAFNGIEYFKEIGKW